VVRGDGFDRSRPALKASLGWIPTRRAIAEAAAPAVTECCQKSPGTERAVSENRSNAAVVAMARTVERPNTVTARQALSTLPESP
jgi:hypothetical protein